MAEANELVKKGFRILSREEDFDLSCFAYASEAAAACFKEALAVDPDMFEAWIGLGNSYAYSPNKFDDALAAYTKAQEIKPDNPESYYQLGRLFLSRAERDYEIAGTLEYEKAAQFFQEGARREYFNRGILYDRLGTTYFRLERYDQALECFEKSAAEVRQGSALPSTYFLAARINELHGNPEEALRWYELYLAKGFNDDDVRLTIRNLKTMLQNRKKVL